jgi:hypothetical protein
MKAKEKKPKNAAKITSKQGKKVKKLIHQAVTKPRNIRTPRNVTKRPTKRKPITGTVIPNKNGVEVYAVNDSLLSDIPLPSETPIKIEIGSDTISLYVGPRDWQWARGTGMLVGCGTALTDEEPDVEEEEITPSINSINLDEEPEEELEDEEELIDSENGNGEKESE